LGAGKGGVTPARKGEFGGTQLRESLVSKKIKGRRKQGQGDEKREEHKGRRIKWDFQGVWSHAQGLDKCGTLKRERGGKKGGSIEGRIKRIN